MEWWIKIHRKLLDNPIASNPALIWFFCYLLLKVSHKKNIFYLWNEKIIQEPWQWIISQKKLAKEFNVSIWTINRWLIVMQTETIIEIKWTNKYTVLTILNREKYQSDWNQNENRMKPNGNNQEWKEWKEWNKELNLFVERWNNSKPFWIAKKSLPKTRKITEKIKLVWKQAIKEYSYEEIIEATNNYCKYVDKLKPKDEKDTYYQHRFTLYEFLKQDNWLQKFFNL